MKQRLLILFLLFYTGAHAQKIHFTDYVNIWKGFVHVDMPQIPYSTFGWQVDATRDTVYQGQNYRIIGAAMVREDTAAGKVYAIAMYTSIPFQDTAEQIMYDYNLVPGDTLFTHYAQDHFAAVVQDTGATFINGVRHRVQQFVPAASWGFPRSYYVIEGIGCTSYPSFPLAPVSEFGISTTCFFQRTTQPPVSPAVYGFNNIGCSVGINDIAPTSFAVSPNPASGSTTVSFKNTFSGSLSVISADGRLQQTIAVDRQQKLQLDCSNLAAGVYFILFRSSENKIIGRQKISVY